MDFRAPVPAAPLPGTQPPARAFFIDRWGTPNFYVLKDGQVQERLTGWPDDSQLDELVRLIESVD